MLKKKKKTSLESFFFFFKLIQTSISWLSKSKIFETQIIRPSLRGMCAQLMVNKADLRLAQGTGGIQEMEKVFRWQKGQGKGRFCRKRSTWEVIFHTGSEEQYLDRTSWKGVGGGKSDKAGFMEEGCWNSETKKEWRGAFHAERATSVETICGTEWWELAYTARKWGEREAVTYHHHRGPGPDDTEEAEGSTKEKTVEGRGQFMCDTLLIFLARFLLLHWPQIGTKISVCECVKYNYKYN